MFHENSGFKLLFKHFMRGYFYNDTIKLQDSFQSQLISMMVFLGVIGGMISYDQMFPFLLWKFSRLTMENFFAVKVVLNSFSMIIAGILGVMVWEKSLVDEGDKEVLFPLPIKRPVIVAAKFSSLVTYIGLVVLVFNLLSLVIFWGFMDGMLQEDAIVHHSTFYCGIMHLLTAFVSSISVFILVLIINRFLKFLPGNWGAKISAVFQVTSVILFISLIFMVGEVKSSALAFQKAGVGNLEFYPPGWFGALFQNIVGYGGDQFSKMSLYAIISTIGAFILYIGILTYSAFSSEVIDTSRGFKKEAFGMGKSGKIVFPSDKLARGFFCFFLISFTRIKKVRLLMGIILALPLGYFVSNISSLQKGGEFNSFVSSISIIFLLTLVVAFKASINRSENPKARWIFFASDPFPPDKIMKVVRRFFVVYLLTPSTLVFIGFYAYYYDFTIGLYHSIYSATVALIIFELIFMNYLRVPFVTELSPSKYDLKIVLPIWFTGAFLYNLIFSWIGVQLFNSREYYTYTFWGLGFLWLVLLCISFLRKRSRKAVLEEDEDAVMVSLFD